jgi:hypothetical protein
MRHWKLREGMKQGIIAWRPARFVSGVFQLLQRASVSLGSVRLIRIRVSVKALPQRDDLLEGDAADLQQHPIAIALRRQDDCRIADRDHAAFSRGQTDGRSHRQNQRRHFRSER